MTEPLTFSPEHAGKGQDVRDAVRVRLEIERAQELAYLRTYMRGVYLSRRHHDVNAYITADDVAWQYDHAMMSGDLPQSSSRTFLGQVFKAPGWEKTGAMVKSRQPKNHGRNLYCWKYVEPSDGTTGR